MKKLWNILNGNKTIICSGTAALIQEGIRQGVIHDSKGLQFAISIILILGGGALIHHAKKGYFNSNKGN